MNAATRVGLLGALLSLALPAAADPLVFRGPLHLGDGSAAIGEGVVVVEAGKIAAAGPAAQVEVPAGARAFAVPGGITPGLVEACSNAGVTNPSSWSEHESEVVPHLRVRDAVDLESLDFKHLAARGITTVFVSSGPGSVIGSQGVALKTAGPAGRRVLIEAGPVKATLGNEAWRRGTGNRNPAGNVSFTTRRPTTRMGWVWVFRDAFAQAAAAEEPTAAQRALREVMAGTRTLRMQARRQNDIETALRLSAEFGIERFVLEEAGEAADLLDLLAARRIPTIFGPIDPRPGGYRGGQIDEPNLATPRLLHARGIPFCLTANDATGEGDLWGQALLAVRYGLAPDAALAAITGWPAEILGGAAAERVGQLRAGRDADLVLWSGPPLEATSRPLAVLVDGELVAGAWPEAGAAAPRTPKQNF